MDSSVLEGSIFGCLYKTLGANSDLELSNRLTSIAIYGTVIISLWNYFMPAPYGRYSNSLYGPAFNAKVSWMIQEVPSVAVPLAFMLLVPCQINEKWKNTLAVLLFVAHYVQRSMVYPMRIGSNARPTPIAVSLFAFTFCTFNGILQGHHILFVSSISTSPNFFVGIAIFILGMAINIYHDGILLSLKKKKERANKGEYIIPHGGLFNYVSGANYFGEIVEWWGLALITLGTPQVVFALFTTMFLGIRACQHHRFYTEKFGASYPKERKAVIPLLF